MTTLEWLLIIVAVWLVVSIIPACVFGYHNGRRDRTRYATGPQPRVTDHVQDLRERGL